MKSNNCKLFLMPIIALISVLSLSACVNDNVEDQNAYLTQCISNPGLNSKSKLFETIFTGNKVSCHALLWRIPKEYLPKNNRTSMRNDYLSQRVAIDNPPQSILPPWKARERQKTTITIFPYWHKPNETLMVSFKKTQMAAYSLEKVESNLNGWEVYDCKRSSCDAQSIAFYKSKPLEYLVSCSPGDRSKNYMNIPAKTVCHVQTFVDGRVYAEYPVLYESFEEWDEINNRVISFLESLMLN